MDLIANLESYPVADAMQWASSPTFSGVLDFRRNKRRLLVSFDDGKVVRCESNVPRESFGWHLFASGLISREELARAQRHGGRGQSDVIGVALEAMGVLTRREIRDEYARHCKALAASLIAWPDGIVAAHSQLLTPLPDLKPKPIDPLFTVLEGARRLDELIRLRQTIAHDNVRIATTEETDSRPMPLAIARVLERIEGESTVGELYGRVGGCKFAFLVNVDQLLDRGLLQVTAEGEPPPDPRRNTLAIGDLLRDAEQEASPQPVA